MFRFFFSKILNKNAKFQNLAPLLDSRRRDQTNLDSLVSYSMPDGSFADGLDLKDTSYDGVHEPNGTLSEGLGKLYDGILGKDNFEKYPYEWLGWRKDTYGKNNRNFKKICF